MSFAHEENFIVEEASKRQYAPLSIFRSCQGAHFQPFTFHSHSFPSYLDIHFQYSVWLLSMM
jgi:hypothetical protein